MLTYLQVYKKQFFCLQTPLYKKNCQKTVTYKTHGCADLRTPGMNIVNDTHRERLVFHSVQYRNGWLAASDLFDMFTQSIKL